jgi:alpha-1,6-mannosyltransferase
VVTCTHVWLSPYTKVEESFGIHVVWDVMVHGLGRAEQVCQRRSVRRGMSCGRDEWWIGGIAVMYDGWVGLDGMCRLTDQWDHVTFPGAVPRSFLPGILLAVVTYPLAVLSVWLGIIKTTVGTQILGTLSAVVSCPWASSSFETGDNPVLQPTGDTVYPKHMLTLPVRMVLAGISAFAFNHLARTIRGRYGPSTKKWFLLLSLSQFHIPYYASRTLPNFMALPGGTSCLLQSSRRSS